MPGCGNISIGLLCVLASSGISAQAIAAPPARKASLKVGGLTVAKVLQKLGAKLETGATSNTLKNYENHFNFSDSNRDGKHTRKEFVENGRYLTARARAGIFRAADGNRDDVVTKDEYLLNRIITDEAKTILQKMDDNNNSLVERAEFLKHTTKQLPNRKIASQIFAALDTNANGELFIPEYLRVWGKWARAGQKSASKRIAIQLAKLASKPNK